MVGRRRPEFSRRLSFTGGFPALLVTIHLVLLPGCKSRAAGAASDGGARDGSGGSSGSGSGGGAGGNAPALDGAAGGAGSGGGDANAPDAAPADAGDAAAGSTAGDAAVAGLKLPVTRGDLQVLEFGSLLFTVKPSLGARITSFQFEGDELLTDASENAQFFGSTLWTSPADDWGTGDAVFTVPSIVDRDPYQSTVSADGVITASNGLYTTPRGGNKTFSITKVFRADIANQAIVIDYKITNRGMAPFQLSHWEVTRVFPDGLTFFATGTGNKIDFLTQPVLLTQARGHTWYDNTTHVATIGESKAGAETPGGFIAHVVPNPRGDLLFIKAFNDVAPTAAPPGHWEVEVFCNDPHTYVELEDHSAYDQIAPGATYTQTVRWYLRRLPVGTDRTIGSAALIAAVRAILGN
jgi:hypothetical protein